MTDHPQAAVEALRNLLDLAYDCQDGLGDSATKDTIVILDLIASLLTSPLQAELDAAYAEAHACGAERAVWKDRAEDAESKLALAVDALTDISESDDPAKWVWGTFNNGAAVKYCVGQARAALAAINGEHK